MFVYAVTYKEDDEGLRYYGAHAEARDEARRWSAERLNVEVSVDRIAVDGKTKGALVALMNGEHIIERRATVAVFLDGKRLI